MYLTRMKRMSNGDNVRMVNASDRTRAGRGSGVRN